MNSDTLDTPTIDLNDNNYIEQSDAKMRSIDIQLPQHSFIEEEAELPLALSNIRSGTGSQLSGVSSFSQKAKFVKLSEKGSAKDKALTP